VPSQYQSIVSSAANRYGVDAGLVAAIIQAESSFNANAKSPAGAQGLMQLMPGTARGLGIRDPYNPEQNVMGGTQYISQMLRKYNDPQLALAAYNWGPGNLDKAIKKYGADWSKIRANAPKETRNYVDKVMKNWRG